MKIQVTSFCLLASLSTFAQIKAPEIVVEDRDDVLVSNFLADSNFTIDTRNYGMKIFQFDIGDSQDTIDINVFKNVNLDNARTTMVAKLELHVLQTTWDNNEFRVYHLLRRKNNSGAWLVNQKSIDKTFNSNYINVFANGDKIVIESLINKVLVTAKLELFTYDR